jgi:hypothetical protein
MDLALACGDTPNNGPAEVGGYRRNADALEQLEHRLCQ